MNHHQAPVLIEPGVKYFFGGVLKECNRLREEYRNTVFNLCMLGFFVLIGDVAAMVEVAQGQTPGNKKAALVRAALSATDRRSVKLVAGAGFEPTTFRL